MLEGSRNFEFIDLKGDGIPGIVYKDEGNFLYAQPLGNGKYKKFTSVVGNSNAMNSTVAKQITKTYPVFCIVTKDRNLAAVLNLIRLGKAFMMAN
jgi:hypothetical protein